MLQPLGHIAALFRYPVKSMAAERLVSAELGWHGIEGDRRMALRRVGDRSAFPWLNASKLPELLRFVPERAPDAAAGAPPSHVRTPEGERLPIFSAELAAEIGRRHGAPVEMMQWKHGLFDDGDLSVLAADTVREIGRLAGHDLDARCFRANVLIRTSRAAPFQEDGWLGGVLSFGDGADAPAISVTLRDARCSMLSLDPESAVAVPEVLQAVVRANQNHAGIYGAVTRTGWLSVGQPVFVRT